MSVNASQIREHMEVVDRQGQHVGTVDRVEGDRIKLTKSDSASSGQHRFIEMAQVEEIKNGKLCVS